jgi:hypothetical protein
MPILAAGEGEWSQIRRRGNKLHEAWLSSHQCCGAESISFGSGFSELHIRILEPAPAPAPFSFIRDLENYLRCKMIKIVIITKTSTATMIFFYKISSSLW